MVRYEQLEEAKLTPEQRRIWDECKARPRGSVPPPVFTGVTEPPKRRLGHQGDAPSRFIWPACG